MATEVVKLELQIPFPSEREAEIAYDVLRIDKEPPRSQVKKTIQLENNYLNVSFTAPEAKQLRVGVTGFFDHILLVCETMNEFGPPTSSEYSHY